MILFVKVKFVANSTIYYIGLTFKYKLDKNIH